MDSVHVSKILQQEASSKPGRLDPRLKSQVCADFSINVAVRPEAQLSEDQWERNALYEEDYLLVHAKNGPDFSQCNFAAATAVSPYVGYSRTGSSDQVEIGRILRSLDIRPKQTVEVASSYALVGLVSELNGWAVIPPTNIWCGWQFAHNLVISPLPGSKRTARTMWVLCDRNLYGGITQLVGEIVKHIFSEKMVPELGAIFFPFGGTRQTAVDLRRRFRFTCLVT